jgi:aryl-alcohol dehydrogenase-like predicted oxidoreductase
MEHEPAPRTDRRGFLQAGALATASALTLGRGADAQDAQAREVVLPRRPLGKTGIDVTLLDIGTGRGKGVDRLLRYAFARGIRAFDTSETYGSEADFKRWFEVVPDVRKQIFLVTKDAPKTPEQLPGMLDKRLAALGTDYVDLLFIHSFGDNHSLADAVAMLKSRELGRTVDAIKKSGKARLVGISTHHKDRPVLLQAAAEGGIVDAVMLQYTPWLDKESPLNKAIDACWNKGIGLISMKQIAGHFLGDKPQGNILDEVVRRTPMLAEKKLTPFQGLLNAIWSDERISAACVSMTNTDYFRENTDAALRFEPLKAAEVRQLRDAALDHGPTLCADCDGRCSLAAGTRAELGNLTRFLTYHEHHGERVEARRLYADLSAEARDWSGADLEAARAACPNKLNFSALLPEVDRLLA